MPYTMRSFTRAPLKRPHRARLLERLRRARLLAPLINLKERSNH